MKYLITGGAGFIGSHIVDRLILDGHDVIVFDDFSTGRLSNLSTHQGKQRVEVVKGSILDVNLTSTLVKRSERVMHFAAAVGVFNIMKNPIESMDINVHGTRNVIQSCIEFGRPILIASSSEVYGKNSSDSLNEESDRIVGAPQKIRWAYSDSKALDESMAISAHQKHGLEVRIVRLFNTVGPRQVGRYGMVVPRFVESALNNSPITIFGNGKQTRCFGHINDITEAIIRVEKCEPAIGRPINIGVDKEVSILELANLVIQLTNSRSPIEFVAYSDAYPPGYEDMERRVPDNRLLFELTGWKAQKSIGNIIEDLTLFITKNR